ncbi:MAG: TatD family hydrolase [Methanothermobacter sp.]|uniref:TatD family hydrolase n=1 Tax=Methanothermobacter tenebrarum TaxID=680118 RepID=UPI002A3F815E|nr:TatD family hydrolase [Methanothermobacter sp.]
MDVHCHINFKDFNKDREEVIKRAKRKLTAIIDSGVGLGGVRRSIRLSEEYKHFIYSTLGLHPADAARMGDELIETIIKEIEDNIERAVGVGESGLDFHHTRDLEGRRRQEKIFKLFIELAIEYELPLIIHARESEKQAFKILKEHPIENAIFHCYSGDLDTAKNIIEEGYHLSFSTMICFIDHHQRLIKDLPLQSILTETDSPYLSPFKGRRNEPPYLEEAVKKIAQLKNTNIQEVDSITEKNAKKIFRI